MNINLKKVISSVAALAMSLSCFTAFAADFSDVADTYSYNDAIDELVALNIVNGYEDGTFKPDNKITRAEVTKMIVAAMGPSYTAAAESSKNSSGFKDVDPVNHWASGFIGIGVAQNFINGMGDGTFAPDANVTYAQIVKMLVSALGYNSAAEMAGGWPNGFLQIGASSGITAGIKEAVGQDTDVTRGQVAKLIRNAIDTPLVVVTSWSTNYITGEPVANTTIMDGGKDQYGNAKAYKTLLTENHDAYVVKGMVDATHATSGTVEVGEVDFMIKNTDSFDGVAYPNATNATKDLNGIALNGTNAEDYLFTYAEAIIKLDEDDNATMVTIKPYGKNEIVELDPALYTGATFVGGTPNKFSDITFRKSATTSSTKTYQLEAAAEIYVNGVKELPAQFTANTLDAFIANNEIGSVTLIDTPDATASVNGLYDYVMIDFADYAIVDSTLTKNEIQYIYLKSIQPDDLTYPTYSSIGATIVMDTEDTDKIYTFVKDGKEIKFEDIKANDVLLVKYDKAAGVSGTPVTASSSRFIVIEVCDKVVSGQVAGISTDDFNNTVYNVNGENYELVSGSLTAGTNYDLYLDATGRVVDYKMTATAANYAVIDRAYNDSVNEENIIRLIKADGTRESYKAKDTTVFTAAETIAYGSGNDASDPLLGYASRLVEYKVNSLGEVVSISAIGATNSGNVAFAANANRVGTVRMDEATKILDLTGIANKVGGNLDDATTYTASDIKAGALSSFVDGELYTVLGYKPAGYNTATFAVVVAGNATVTATTNFAVVNGVGSTFADGITVETLTAYVHTDKTAPVTMVEDEDCTFNFSALNKGDIVVLTMKGDKIADAVKIFDIGTATGAFDLSGSTALVDSYFDVVDAPEAPNPEVQDGYALIADRAGHTTAFIKSNNAFTAWDNTAYTANNWARVGYGVILDNANGVVTMGRVEKLASNETATKLDGTSVTNDQNDYVSKASGIARLDLADNVNVYVYDTTVTGAGQLTAAAAGAIRKTVVSENTVYTDSNGEVYFNWTDIDAAMAGQLTMNYAFYKVVNDEIVDILVIAQ